MNENQRLFIGVRVVPGFKLAKRISLLKAEYPRGIKWVEDENLHMTLLFLGDTDAGILNELIKSVSAVCENTPEMRCDITGLGYFGRSISPSSVWARVTLNSQIEDLHSTLLKACKRNILTEEPKEFRPHITLGRIKNQVRCQDIIKDIYPVKDEPYGRLSISNIDLIKSDITTEGPVYTTIHSFPLSGTIHPSPEE